VKNLFFAVYLQAIPKLEKTNIIHVSFQSGMITKEIQLIETMAIAESSDMRKSKNNGEAVAIPNFKPGDTVNVAVRVIEGDKERIQNYQGIVIARRGTGTGATFRVRKISNGVGVERIFPLYSPIIQSISVVSQGAVRRSKLYYLRGMTERQMRTKTRKKAALVAAIAGKS
jgi:large subunit ribosomal protein L19